MKLDEFKYRWFHWVMLTFCHRMYYPCELFGYWYTSDGRRFSSLKEAVSHSKENNLVKSENEQIPQFWDGEKQEYNLEPIHYE